jgi:nucleoside-diphosphate-sugar epimerase
MEDRTPDTILVSGGTGFVGKHLVKKLLQKKYKVNLLIRANSNLAQFGEAELKSLSIHEYNGTYGGMDEIIKRVKPDIVFHLASLYITEHKPEDIPFLLDSNIELGTFLVEAMVNNNCFKLINAGTSWQHYNNDAYNPVNLYAATKQAFESIVHYYTEACGLKAITLKLFDTYGPEDQRKKLISLLYHTAAENKDLEMSGGEQHINLVYIDDVVNAFLCALDRVNEGNISRKNETFAVSSNEIIKLREFVKLFEEIVGQQCNVQFGAKEYRLREVMLPWNKGEAVPGWEPKYSLKRGLKETVKSMRNL